MTQLEDISGLEASLLLTLPAADLSTPRASASGPLSLSSLSPSSSPDTSSPSAVDHKVFLTLRLAPLELVLERSHPVTRSTGLDGARAYILHAYPPADVSAQGVSCEVVSLRLPVPREAQVGEYEILDAILSQYSAGTQEDATPAAPPQPRRMSTPALSQGKIGSPLQAEELRGSLIFMDESSGEVLGQITAGSRITEDGALSLSERPPPDCTGSVPELTGDAGPVVVELPSDAYDAYTCGEKGGDVLSALADARNIFVHAASPEEMDWFMQGADLLSRAIDSSTSLLVSGLTSASAFYTSHTASASAPSHFTSPTTQSALRTAHAVSGHAARASRQTADLVEGLLVRAVGGGRDVARCVGQVVKEAGGVREGMLAGAGEKAVLEEDAVREGGAPPPYDVYEEKGKGRERETEGAQESPSQGLGMTAKLALSANLLVATMDDSAQRLWEAGSGSLAQVVGHKYGSDAAQTTRLAAGTARNVVLVYVDVRGFARRALVRKAGAAYVKSQMVASSPRGAATSAALSEARRAVPLPATGET